jgi:hypothetical protein
MPKPERTCNFPCISSHSGKQTLPQITLITLIYTDKKVQWNHFELENPYQPEASQPFAEAAKARIFTTEKRRHGEQQQLLKRRGMKEAMASAFAKAVKDGPPARKIVC